MTLFWLRNANNNFSDTNFTNNKNRSLLSYVIIFGAFILIFYLIRLSVEPKIENNSTAESIKYIFNGLIPMIATWVGAVIAFYFGQKNFESAARQYTGITKSQLDDLKVENVMIAEGTMVVQLVDDDNSNNLEQVKNLYKNIKKSRVPFIDKQNHPKYVIHLSTITDFISESDDEKIMLSSLLSKHKNMFTHEATNGKGFVTVSPNDTIQNALNKMRNLNGCKDIIVTKNGTKDSEVVGWLTDTLLTRFLNV